VPAAFYLFERNRVAKVEQQADLAADPVAAAATED
jgi:hypothetical protein